MVSIEPNLSHRIQTTLLNCDVFNSDLELKAMFLDERLYPWRNQLPQATNSLTRVQLVMDLLSRQIHHNMVENGLVLLLRVTSSFMHSGNQLHHDLAQLADELAKTELSELPQTRLNSLTPYQFPIQGYLSSLVSELKEWKLIHNKSQRLITHVQLLLINVRQLQKQFDDNSIKDFTKPWASFRLALNSLSNDLSGFSKKLIIKIKEMMLDFEEMMEHISDKNLKEIAIQLGQKPLSELKNTICHATNYLSTLDSYLWCLLSVADQGILEITEQLSLVIKD